jgi:aspartyl-tRNA(Asn)/glutamyl-tRNA(Gln) amidotransferase subunit B
VLAGAEQGVRTVFDEAVAGGAEPQAVANWATGEVTAWLRREERSIEDTGLTGVALGELVSMVAASEVSASAAKDVLDGMLRGEGGAREVAESRDLLQVSDTGAIEEAVDDVLAANPDAVERFRGGEKKVLGFLVGQVMRATQGKADPKVVNQLLGQKLS